MTQDDAQCLQLVVDRLPVGLRKTLLEEPVWQSQFVRRYRAGLAPPAPPTAEEQLVTALARLAALEEKLDNA